MADGPPIGNPNEHRPILLLLGSHWVSMLGVTLVTLAGCSWLIVLPLHMRGSLDNPYIGILAFLVLPAIFFTGLILIPIGLVLAKHRVQAGLESLPDRRTAWRRLAIFIIAGTCVNVIIGSQLTYRAVAYMETKQFCGESCHVMKPEFTAWSQMPPHQTVECVSCHVVPGAVGYLKAKSAGTMQMVGVVLNSYPRPIPSAMESDKLAPAADTCEGCHSRERFVGDRLRVITQHKDDEANSPSYTVLMMKIGGGTYGGIHGAHMGPGVTIRYAAADAKRQKIPWVEYENTAGSVKRTYLAADAKPGDATSLPQFDMQCVDCHNRAAHSFEVPERALDRALTFSQISPTLPFAKKEGLELLKATYSSNDDASQKIPAAFSAFYQQKYPDVSSKRAQDIQAAGQAVAAIYNRNVFPDLKVTWGTYPNNLGHTDYIGCFRCHDDNHATSEKKTISQDCSTCHESLAMEEASPEILKSLGLIGKTGAERH